MNNVNSSKTNKHHHKYVMNLEKIKGNKSVGSALLFTLFSLIASLFIPLFWNPLYLFNQVTFGLLFGDLGTLLIYTGLSIWTLNYFFGIQIMKKLRINKHGLTLLISLSLLMIIGASYNAMTGNPSYAMSGATEVFNVYWLDPWTARWSLGGDFWAPELMFKWNQMGILTVSVYYVLLGFAGSLYSLLLISFATIFAIFLTANYNPLSLLSKKKQKSKAIETIFSGDLKDIKTQEIKLSDLEETKKKNIFEQLDPNDPKDLLVLKALKRADEISSKPYVDPRITESRLSEKQRLDKLKQDIIERKFKVIDKVSQEIQSADDVDEIRRRKILEKGSISPTRGRIRVEEKQEELIETHSNDNLTIADELTIDNLFKENNSDNAKIENTLEEYIENSLQSKELEKTIEVQLAFSTSHSMQEISEKSDLSTNDIQEEIDRVADNFEPSLITSDIKNPEDELTFADNNETALEEQFVNDIPATVKEKTKERTLEKEITLEEALSLDNKEEDAVYHTAVEDFEKKYEKWCKRFKAPSVDLLQDAKPNTALFAAQNNEAKHKAELLNNLFVSFNIDAKVSAFQIGPTVTTYEVEVGTAVKLTKITALENNIKLTLEASQIRIQAPIPGRSVVGIEAPNGNRKNINYKEVFNQMKTDGKGIWIAFGQDVFGKTLAFDLTKTPHLLVAGSTGSGKSVAINTLIISILMQYSPKEVQMILVDPKIIEFTPYQGIPHLMTPIITSAQNANLALKEVVNKMEERYHLMAEYRVRNIIEFNDLMKRQNKDTLPYIVVIIDELADLMAQSSKEVEESITRITQKARAAGIHLIVATQRPSVNVITGVIKANIPSRIAFTVAASVDSKVILDRPGAEKLIGQGDMLISLYGQIPFRGQGSWISNEEIERIVEHVKDQCETFYTIEIKQQDPILGGMGGVLLAKNDPMLKAAAQIIIQNQKVSVSLVQRYLKVGYNKAANIVDSLEKYGIIGPNTGARDRDILITESEINSKLS